MRPITLEWSTAETKFYASWRHIDLLRWMEFPTDDLTAVIKNSLHSLVEESSRSRAFVEKVRRSWYFHLRKLFAVRSHHQNSPIKRQHNSSDRGSFHLPKREAYDLRLCTSLQPLLFVVQCKVIRCQIRHHSTDALKVLKTFLSQSGWSNNKADRNSPKSSCVSCHCFLLLDACDHCILSFDTSGVASGRLLQ